MCKTKKDTYSLICPQKSKWMEGKKNQTLQVATNQSLGEVYLASSTELRETITNQTNASIGKSVLPACAPLYNQDKLFNTYNNLTKVKHVLSEVKRHLRSDLSPKVDMQSKKTN